MPHPPIMIPEVGGPETKDVDSTIKSAETVGREIQELNPDTIVIIFRMDRYFRMLYVFMIFL